MTWGNARRWSAVAWCILAGCGGAATSASTPAASVAGPATATTLRVGPLTPANADALQPEDAAAIVALGRSTAGPPTGAHSHGHSTQNTALTLPMFTGDALTFADQWLAARAAAPWYDTTAKAKALGFVRTAAPAPGVGTHWIKWSWVAQPFDPAKPSMLLFDETRDPPALVGYSYLLQSAAAPVGFAGENDPWHQHTGLCIVNGWVDREESAGPQSCAGTYLAGGDIWMLHAWVVPAYANPDGRFANSNALLCPKASSVPDFARCGGLTAG